MSHCDDGSCRWRLAGLAYPSAFSFTDTYSLMVWFIWSPSSLSPSSTMTSMASGTTRVTSGCFQRAAESVQSVCQRTHMVPGVSGPRGKVKHRESTMVKRMLRLRRCWRFIIAPATMLAFSHCSETSSNAALPTAVLNAVCDLKHEMI